MQFSPRPSTVGQNASTRFMSREHYGGVDEQVLGGGDDFAEGLRHMALGLFSRRPRRPLGTGNTIGTVRVACSNGGTVESPVARMTSGASAPIPPRAYESRQPSAVAQRVPVRRLVLELQATRRRE